MKAIKELGQHFLTDAGIAGRIADLGQILPGERIWEIGPGHGILTQEILSRGADLEAFELDSRMAKPLSDRFTEGLKLQIIDILKLDWAEQISSGSQPLKLIANIPYQITSPLLYRLEKHHASFSRIVMMIQKEVAERLSADPGGKSYGPLTLRLALKYDISSAFMVGKEHFEPVPKVDSMVITMTPRQNVPVINRPALFHALIIAAFAHRRKTLRNNLLLMIGKDKLQKLESISEIDFGRRAQTLSEDDFIRLSDLIAEL
ncbi:MAG: 16S rRNA (adenine(1518)-N(6)/adenine(1519)-N(6))-dimethyltransferase RsmA [Candidatus Cloacimonetes bacterium]|jgi:16S rRNA (adenine1518-N6/adenine1519-N6)-dimethyltransferase|nr:16S rRNA (adenine(1518)-N(6)/adenine(1519)-N(6))-dimethyltransferase RsmA [Candidatus Cloacimonadota bacterium]MDY0325665.1 16S rRNA (adenine(1518)-N(6)/adenine(1519)-N(6))-dimethyltransferase RsmA [Candidatus Cloacimonadaceae bacterium]